MFRVLLCITCCSAPASRPSKRRASSNRNPNVATKDPITAQESPGDALNDKDQLLSNQIQANNNNYGTKEADQQGKLTLPTDDTNEGSAVVGSHLQSMNRDSGLAPETNSAKVQSASSSTNRSKITDASIESHGGDYVGSALTSTEIGPFGESFGITVSHATDTASGVAPFIELQHTCDGEPSVRADETLNTSGVTYQPFIATGIMGKNVPSTTKIGDYARIEYSPVEDLESVTTMSYSRMGSEKGGSHSRADSFKANTTGGTSRRSSQGGLESTSISIASQLSNEQFQQNLTNMLESVNSNYQTIGVIGLPLGPPMEGTLTETSKTSPETPGAALTSASQDSLSDAAFDNISPPSSRPETLRSSSSRGAALVGDSFEKSNILEELADFAQPAPLASGEDDEQPLTAQDYNKTSTGELNPARRVGSPQSITTTTSGGLTNPTPTPSELSGGSGKKRSLRAKSLLKKLRPGSKKNKNKETN